MPQAQRHTIYSRDLLTFLAPRRIKWFPVYSSRQLLYPQGRAALVVNAAEVQICFAEVACFFCWAIQQLLHIAFGSRRLSGNSQMLEYGRGLTLTTLGSAGMKEFLRFSSTSTVCWSVSGAIRPPSPASPGSFVLQAYSWES